MMSKEKKEARDYPGHRELSDFRRFGDVVLQDKDEAPVLPWLDASFVDSQGFLQQLFEHLDASGVRAAKSEFAGTIDLYHDLVLRNTDPERIALRWFERGEWQELSYSNLHAACNTLYRQWIKRGLVPGQSLCLIRKLNRDFVVELLSAFRLGLVVSLIPPFGDQFIRRRLEALGPDFIIVEALYERLLTGFEDQILTKEEGGQHAAPADDDIESEPLVTHVAEPEDVVLQLFPTLQGDPVTPVAIGARDLLIYAQRDATVSLSLAANDHFVDCGLSLLKYQPTLLIAVLNAGATYVMIDREQVEQDIELLGAFERSTIILDPALRERMVQRPQALGKTWTRWLRNPADTLHWHRWQDFLEAHELKETPIGNLVYDAALGGACLFSHRRRGGVNNFVLPVPGISWQLGDVPATHFSVLGSIGIFADVGGKQASAIGAILLAEFGKEWLYLGTYEARRAGQLYPKDEVLEAISDLSFVKGATVVARAGSSEAAPYVFGLLIFLGHLEQEEAEGLEEEQRAAIETAIDRHMGKSFLPDELILLPLYPRLVNGKMNHPWNVAQYLSGSLQHRSENKLFQIVNRARRSTVGT
jgi:hypothetical protein